MLLSGNETRTLPFCLYMYRVTTINVSRKWIEWAEWAALSCTANSPFPGHVYCRHPVVVGDLVYIGDLPYRTSSVVQTQGGIDPKKEGCLD